MWILSTIVHKVIHRIYERAFKYIIENNLAVQICTTRDNIRN